MMSGCDSRQPHHSVRDFRTGRAPAVQPSLQNSACSGQHRGGLPFANRAYIYGVVADKQCTCFASKLMRERSPPTPPFYRGENEIQASLISSASVGATPTPATTFREVIRLPVCKTGVKNNCRK